MDVMILIALFNGGFIALSRTLNGTLATNSNALVASCCNHIMGFVLLSMWLICLGSEADKSLVQPPVYLYLGGIIGAVFVVLNSWVLPALGVMRCTLLVICGQMLTAVVLDALSSSIHPMSVIGVILMIMGVAYLNRAKQVISQRKRVTC